MNYKHLSLIGAAMLGTAALSARTVTGTISAADGVTPVPTWVSDGYSFAYCGNDGRYSIELNPKAETIYVHRPDGWFTEDFYYLLDPARSEYDFSLFEVPCDKSAPVNILITGDTETTDTSYFDELTEFITNNPQIDFVFNAGDINGRNGMQAHRDNISLDTFCRPVHYVIGNHDIVKRNPGEADCFTELIAPWYYTFEVNDILFITAPMYDSWGVPLPYNMKEYGDWVQKLMDMYPAEKIKVLMCHDIPDLVGDRIFSNHGDIMLDDYNFCAILYGHKHMNIVMRYDSGRKAYSTTTTTFGGVGFHAPGFRCVTINHDGSVSSTTHYTKIDDMLQAGSDGRSVWATIYNSGDEVASAAAVSASGEKLELYRVNKITWGANLSEGFVPENVSAVTVTGREFSGPVASSNLKLLTVLPNDTAVADLIADGGILYAAVCDDTDAETGGIYAIDRNTGGVLWFAPTWYSIRNNIAQDENAVYWTDARGNIGATAKADGSLIWYNQADLSVLLPTTASAAVANGVVIGGYGAMLRGIDAATGQTLWVNDKWVERTPAKDQLPCDDTTVYVNSQLNGLCAHDIQTGELRWQFKNLFISGSACIAGDYIFLKGENDIFKLDINNGQKIAQKYYGGLKSASVPVVYDDLLIFGTAQKGIMAVRQSDLSQVWVFTPGDAMFDTTYYARKPHPTVEATPVICGDNLLAGANDGWLYRLDCATGAEIDKYFTGAPITSQGVSTPDGKYYFVDFGGKIMELN